MYDVRQVQVCKRDGLRVHPHRTAAALARDKQLPQRDHESAGGEAGGQQRGPGVCVCVPLVESLS